MTDPTPIDLDEVRKRHRRCSGLARCRMPCDAIRLADEIERLQAGQSDFLFHEMKVKTTLATEIDRLREALDEAREMRDLRTQQAQEACIEQARLQSKYTASQEALTELLTEHREQGEKVERVWADNSRLRDELAQAWGLTDADTEAARTAEIKSLREAGTKICEAFDKGIFIRSTSGDGESAWAIKLFPYLQALAVFADNEKGENNGFDTT